MLKLADPVQIDEWPDWLGPSPRMKGKKLKIDKATGVLQVHEGDPTVLLWAHPQLLGWPRTIVWLLAYLSGGPDLVELARSVGFRTWSMSIAVAGRWLP